MKITEKPIEVSKVADIKNFQSSNPSVKNMETARSELLVKKTEHIEKTAQDVQDYFKNLVEDKETLEEVLKFINSDLVHQNTLIEFSFNETINQMMVQVKDRVTGEVIRGLPPEHLVKLMEKFRVNGSLEGVILSKEV